MAVNHVARGNFSPLFCFLRTHQSRGMDKLSVKIISSDLSEDKKQRLLWRVFDLLLEAAHRKNEESDFNEVSTPIRRNIPTAENSPSFR